MRPCEGRWAYVILWLAQVLRRSHLPQHVSRTYLPHPSHPLSFFGSSESRIGIPVPGLPTLSESWHPEQFVLQTAATSFAHDRLGISMYRANAIARISSAIFVVFIIAFPSAVIFCGLFSWNSESRSRIVSPGKTFSFPVAPRYFRTNSTPPFLISLDRDLSDAYFPLWNYGFHGAFLKFAANLSLGFLLLGALQRRKEILQDTCQLGASKRPFDRCRICNDIRRRRPTFQMDHSCVFVR